MIRRPRNSNDCCSGVRKKINNRRGWRGVRPAK
jgi:hypothetical protein